MEKEITKIWCRILEIDRIEPDENLFDLGGNSITAMMILEDVNNKFNVGLVSTDLYSTFEAAACIGCGACVAACPNASAMLFTGAKISHLGLLPQGQPERLARKFF